MPIALDLQQGLSCVFTNDHMMYIEYISAFLWPNLKLHKTSTKWGMPKILKGLEARKDFRVLKESCYVQM